MSNSCKLSLLHVYMLLTVHAYLIGHLSLRSAAASLSCGPQAWRVGGGGGGGGSSGEEGWGRRGGEGAVRGRRGGGCSEGTDSRRVRNGSCPQWSSKSNSSISTKREIHVQRKRLFPGALHGFLHALFSCMKPDTVHNSDLCMFS